MKAISIKVEKKGEYKNEQVDRDQKAGDTAGQ